MGGFFVALCRVLRDLATRSEFGADFAPGSKITEGEGRVVRFLGSVLHGLALFQAQEVLFAFQPARVTGQASVGVDDAVPGESDHHTVLSCGFGDAWVRYVVSWKVRVLLRAATAQGGSAFEC
ncbi:hypothetical protein GCM10009603_60900 [Nocardiopsis exhalans]